MLAFIMRVIQTRIKNNRNQPKTVSSGGTLSEKKFQAYNTFEMMSSSQCPVAHPARLLLRSASTDDESGRECSPKEPRPEPPKYKTEMCKNFSENGCCPYRDRCQFAHGTHELHRGLPLHKKAYRTKKCKSFWEEGVCRYGFRCQFQHYGTELTDETSLLQVASCFLCSRACNGQSKLNWILK